MSAMNSVSSKNQRHKKPLVRILSLTQGHLKVPSQKLGTWACGLVFVRSLSQVQSQKNWAWLASLRSVAS